MKAKGLTLTELVVTVAVLAILMPLLASSGCGLSKASELGKRAKCGANMSAMGKAQAMYMGSSTDGAYPYMIASATWDIAPTGANRSVEQHDTNTSRAVTALMFMLVRDGQPAGIFNCPSDSNAVECQNTKSVSSNQYYWDFENAPQCSYSYQLPTAGNKTNGITSVEKDAKGNLVENTPMSLIIAADKAPAGIDLGTFSATVTGKSVQSYMSPNHTGGEYINFLRADSSVGNAKRPDIGIKNDFIYTASGKADSVAQYGGTASQAAHLFKDDSVLFGPK